MISKITTTLFKFISSDTFKEKNLFILLLVQIHMGDLSNSSATSGLGPPEYVILTATSKFSLCNMNSGESIK